jgi:hypothetical protein
MRWSDDPTRAAQRADELPLREASGALASCLLADGTAGEIAIGIPLDHDVGLFVRSPFSHPTPLRDVSSASRVVYATPQSSQAQYCTPSDCRIRRTPILPWQSKHDATLPLADVWATSRDAMAHLEIGIWDDPTLPICDARNCLVPDSLPISQPPGVRSGERDHEEWIRRSGNQKKR